MRIVKSVKRQIYLLALLPLTAGLSVHRVSPLSVALESCIARMHKAMHSTLARTTGGPDATFAATMIAHHEGAIAMAQAELRFGKNEQLRRLAQEIIVTQQQEIAVMRLALGSSASLRGPRSAR